MASFDYYGRERLPIDGALQLVLHPVLEAVEVVLVVAGRPQKLHRVGNAALGFSVDSLPLDVLMRTRQRH